MIKVTDLLFRYAGNESPAINGLSVTIPAGKYTAIMGHNGSGKSTLAKLLVGLYKPAAGTIDIDGVTISKATLTAVRTKIGMVFQNPDNQFVGATVEDDIAFGLENKRVAREIMRPLIEKYAAQVGMLMYLDKEPQNLSGGQKQRVAIAATLALDPQIIIFDEITSMLDPRGKTEVLRLIKRIQEAKTKTLISITHDMDEASMADWALVFADGKLIAQGRPHEILTNAAVVKQAKIDAPFVYRVSALLHEAKPRVPLTFDEDELVEAICAL